MKQYPWSPFDDYRIEFIGEQATCSAVVTYTNDHWAAQVDLWGTDGMLKIDLQTKSLIDYRRPMLDSKGVGLSALGEAAQIASNTFTTGTKYLSGRFRNTHEILIEDFLNCVISGRPPTVTANDGRLTVGLMDRIVTKLGQLDMSGCA